MKSEEKTINALVHRLVAQEFVENPNNYKYVRHKDGDPQNNYFENLEWVAEGGDQVLFTDPKYSDMTAREMTMSYTTEE